VPIELWKLAPDWDKVCREIALAARAASESADEMVIEGAHAALEHPEFRDVDRLSQYLSLLQERAALLEILDGALATAAESVLDNTTSSLTQSQVKVTIGTESGLPGMTEYAVVSSPYYVGMREAGAIGVFGPKRMDYARSTAAVDLMARTVGEVLTRLSVAP
jgi:transcriptional regulator of heat shock response